MKSGIYSRWGALKTRLGSAPTSSSSKPGDYRITGASMNPVLKLLIDGGSLTTGQMAKVAGLTEAEVNQHLEQLKKDKIFLGWRPVLDLSHEAAAASAVRA